MPHQLDSLEFYQSFVLRVVSIEFDTLGSTGLLSVKSDLLLDQLNKNGLVGEVSLRFYRGV
jgi:hypothetical protein